MGDMFDAAGMPDEVSRLAYAAAMLGHEVRSLAELSGEEQGWLMLTLAQAINEPKPYI